MPPTATCPDVHRLLAESLTDPAVILIDPDGRVRGWNPGAGRLLGYPERTSWGALDRLFTPEDRDRGEPARELQTAAEDGRATDTRWLVRRDGRGSGSAG